MIDLNAWGFSEKIAAESSQYENLQPARVVEQQRSQYTVVCEEGLMPASVSGKFIHDANQTSDYPAVGDWVMVSTQGHFATIHKVLTRKSSFERKAAGRKDDTQIIAANIDIVFLCMSLNQDFNIRRLERFLSVAWSSGAIPVIVLTKTDLCDHVDEIIRDVALISFGTKVIPCSGMTTDGYEQISAAVIPGKTIAFIGASGVGKSTIINHLKGEDILKTNPIREDGKGKHTTTHRQLILLPNGSMVIDTPGMRELGIESADFANTFTDIEDLISACKYSDCTHTSEPGCAILAAIQEGSLDPDRFENYRKLQVEAAYSEMSSRQIDEEKISKMFGSKSMMQKRMKEAKDKNSRR